MPSRMAWPMAAAITVAGMGISATLAGAYRIAEMAYRIAEMTVPAGQRTEAMSWVTTAAAAGTALGAPLAGSLIDTRGAAAGYLFAFSAGLLGVVVVALRRKQISQTPIPRWPAWQHWWASGRSRSMSRGYRSAAQFSSGRWAAAS
jgi:MFS family permease